MIFLNIILLNIKLFFVNKVYTDLFVINANLSCIYSNKVQVNQQALKDLFELYLLYGITNVYSGDILKVF
jgi:hypothetical protein